LLQGLKKFFLHLGDNTILIHSKNLLVSPMEGISCRMCSIWLTVDSNRQRGKTLANVTKYFVCFFVVNITTVMKRLQTSMNTWFSSTLTLKFVNHHVGVFIGEKPLHHPVWSQKINHGPHTAISIL